MDVDEKIECDPRKHSHEEPIAISLTDGKEHLSIAKLATEKGSMEVSIVMLSAHSRWNVVDWAPDYYFLQPPRDSFSLVACIISKLPKVDLERSQ